MMKQKSQTSLPEWFFNLKDGKKYLKYIFNLSPTDSYFEKLKEPFVGIVIQDIHRYGYIVEFTDSTFATMKNVSHLEYGEYIAIKYNNIENKMVYDSTEKEQSK